MNQLQEEVLDRVRKDLETRISEQDANSVSIKLQESVDELNVKFPAKRKHVENFAKSLDNNERMRKTNRNDKRKIGSTFEFN